MLYEYRIMNELPWITILGKEWGDLAIIFTSDEVTSENHWQIAWRVTQKSLFMVTNVSLYFLLFYVLNTQFHQKQSSIADFAIVTKDGLFWLCDVITVYLWHHTKWHCEVIFVDCFCMHKLAQRRSSLVNNSREYRFLTTWYSRLNV